METEENSLNIISVTEKITLIIFQSSIQENGTVSNQRIGNNGKNNSGRIVRRS
jgi:hypothetical protein